MTRTTISELLADARSRLERLQPEAALAAQDSGAVIVDTRSSDERSRDGVIPGSLHIPLSVLPWRVDPDAEPGFHNPTVSGLDQWLVLVCAHGYSSSIAAATLQDLGFSRATDLAGGFEAWKEQGMPVAAAPEIDQEATPGMGPPDPASASP
jgi:rhodanese-related sulfurtransferase